MVYEYTKDKYDFAENVELIYKLSYYCTYIYFFMIF